MNKLDTIEIVVEDIGSPTIVDPIRTPDISTNYINTNINNRNVAVDKAINVTSCIMVVLMIAYYNFAFYLIDCYPKKYCNTYQIIKLLFLIPIAIIGNIICIWCCISAYMIRFSNSSEV